MTRSTKIILASFLLLVAAGVGFQSIEHHKSRSAAQSTASTPPVVPMTMPDCPDSAGNHINIASGVPVCGNSMPTIPAAYLSGTTGNIGGSLLLLGGTSSGTATVTGASAGMPCIASPSDGTNIVGLGLSVGCTVTASNTVTVNIVAFVSVTPTAKPYSVRVFP